MNAKRLLLSGLLLGIAGDLLLRLIPWGLGSAIWWAAFVTTAVFLGDKGRPQDWRRSTAVAFFAAAVAIEGMVWRDSEVLVVLDVLLLIGAAVVISLPARSVDLFATAFFRAAGAVVLTALKAVAGFPQLIFLDMKWRDAAAPRQSVVTAVRGVLLAIPLLLIFGALLMSADEQFQRLIETVFRFDLAEVAGHLFVTAIVAAVCCGYLRSIAVPAALPDFQSPITLPAAEVNIALGLLDALFALFIIVQARYLFGGTATVVGSPALTLSSYARRGFFELVAVAALVLPLLLILNALVNPHSRLFRAIAAIQVALVLAIEASAFYRMQLYQREFGWTEQRFYTTAFMLWLAFLLVLLSSGKRFLAGAAISAIVAVFILNTMNPDAFMVRANLARAAEGKRPLDAAYVTSLSADSVPVLLASWDKLAPHERASFAAKWLPRVESVVPDWRTWNVSRRRARALILARKEELRPYGVRVSPPAPRVSSPRHRR